MGKNKWPNIPLQMTCMNKIIHALDRRQRWQVVRKVLPNKRHGSGKHIIDGGSSEPITNASKRPKVHRDSKKNKHTKNEQETTQTPFKKFRIRSLISEEMAKRRGRRRSLSPKKNTISHKKTENDPQRSKCESPSSIRTKRKCDICATMLTVSYLRQKGLGNENIVIEDEKLHPADKDACYNKTGFTKSFSFPLLEPTKRRSDFKLQQLKHKLRDFKNIQTTKENLSLPMNQWQDVGFPKPMLTRPESFTGLVSSKEKKQSKTLKQKIGVVVKVDTKKEKRRIFMDAVFHKIPYGRKDPKKELKTSSAIIPTSSSSADKTHLKKTSSTSDAISKYHKLLSQTSTRDEKLQLNSSAHKLKLSISGDHSFDKRTHKRIRSLPIISPYDFMHNSQKFLVMDMFDDERPSNDFKLYSEMRNGQETIDKETKSIKKKEVVYEHVELATNTLKKINDQHEFKAGAIESGEKMEMSLVEEEENQKEPRGAIEDYQEQSDNQKQVVDDLSSSNHAENHNGPLAAIEDYQDQHDHQKQVTNEDLNSSNREENQKEPRASIEVENDKSFNEILGSFKKVSEERTKLNSENESSGIIRKVGKKSLCVFRKQEVGQSSLDHQDKEKSPLTSDSKLDNNIEISQITFDHQQKDKSGFEHTSVPQNQKIWEHNEQDQSVDGILHVCQNTLDHIQEEETSCSELILVSSSLMAIPNFQLEGENKRYKFSIKDTDAKRPNNTQADYDRFLNLDLESVEDQVEFLLVKQVLEKSGFLKKESLRYGEYWYSSNQAMDPLLFEEVETNFLQRELLQELDTVKDEEVVQKMINDQHLLLFDLVNEAIMEIHNKTITYFPLPLTYPSKVVPMPEGSRLLEQVWDIANIYLSWKPGLDDVVSHDLSKRSGWMNLQADAEFVGIQLEELLEDDLLDELVFDDLILM